GLAPVADRLVPRLLGGLRSGLLGAGLALRGGQRLPGGGQRLGVVGQFGLERRDLLRLGAGGGLEPGAFPVEVVAGRAQLGGLGVTGGLGGGPGVDRGVAGAAMRADRLVGVGADLFQFGAVAGRGPLGGALGVAGGLGGRDRLLARLFGGQRAGLGVGLGLPGRGRLGLGPPHPGQGAVLRLGQEVLERGQLLLQRADRRRHPLGEGLGLPERLVDRGGVGGAAVPAGLVGVGLAAVLGRPAAAVRGK